MNIKKILVFAAGFVAIAAVIFGSIHIYSTAVAKKIIEQTLNNVSLVSMAPIQRLENPARFTYIFTLKISNPSRLTAEVEMTDWKVQIDETHFEVAPVGQWSAVIHPAKSRDLAFSPKGEITIFEPTIVDLKEKDAVPLIITGEIKVTAKQAWVTQSYNHGFELSSSVIFD
ncbi:MAG: hypothetical protein WCS74_00710 [Dehalococcoidales bacterium]|jgi:hypothetical protein|nr:hypothetical protein [Dehalococcoidales bacterium]MDD3264544.1 hypothetical protein [Dehalococcoidales bacterium]MDD4322386.1 hypothetical protein [Dehalococcoidales bacterium]MDD4794016.1 hypothetical protein [Dehalococcoidales bacterium]MDD5122426.1 hypothetical protein [Dehalococcoidales bacterium]